MPAGVTYRTCLFSDERDQEIWPQMPNNNTNSRSSNHMKRYSLGQETKSRKAFNASYWYLTCLNRSGQMIEIRPMNS